MEKYSRYYGVIGFVIAIIILIAFCFLIIRPKVNNLTQANADFGNKTQTLASKQQLEANIKRKIKKLNDSMINAQKKVYTPAESDLGNDTLFFTLYNDVIEMLHSNSIKIRTIDYTYNPETDMFVKLGKDTYFVCDINMEVVSNYVNLGKLIQDIYQYPYYIRINEIDVNPYQKDKKILVSKISLRLYARTAPAEDNLIKE